MVVFISMYAKNVEQFDLSIYHGIWSTIMIFDKDSFSQEFSTYLWSADCPWFDHYHMREEGYKYNQ